MVVFEGERHVGQLQFRPYVPNAVSPHGLYDPLYWMDFQGHAPELPEKTLAIFCYHVGQTENTTDRDSRYFGRGIGLQLLRKTLEWAQSAGFEAVIAKGCPDYRSVIEFMGGMSSESYRKNGFRVVATYIDDELRSAVKKFAAIDDPDKAAEIGVCVRYLAKGIC